MPKPPVAPDPKHPVPQRYHLARPPYRQVHLTPASPAVPATPASGVTPPPPDAIDVSGGGTNYHNPGDAPASTTTSNNGGPIYLFWGSAWNSSSLNPSLGAIYLALSKLDDRFNNPTTNYFSKLQQYGVGGPGGSAPFSGGFSSSIGPLVIPANPPNNPFSLSDVANEVSNYLNDPLFKAYPALPGSESSITGGIINALIVVFMPPGYTTTGPFGEHSVTSDQYGNQWAFAYISYGTLQQITFVYTHELIESMTDIAGTAWQVNPRNSTSWNEICDVCASGGVVNGTTVTSYWSQSDQSCVIPTPPPPPPPLLPAGDFQIDCVLKGRDESGNPYITHVGGPGNAATDGRWLLTESDVIDLINGGQNSFYTEADGVRANVIEQNWYLTTVADNSLANNLDNLESCYAAAANPPEVPTITGISPPGGVATGGDAVTISGTHLATAAVVNFGSTPAPQMKVVSDSEIDVITPAHPAGIVGVTVTALAGTSVVENATQQFRFATFPAITAVSPTSGPAAGGTLVTITGTGFQGVGIIAVDFGTAYTNTFTIVSDSEITVNAPPNAAGAVDVTLYTDVGTTVKSAADVYTYT
jgi:hypothetical protein